MKCDKKNGQCVYNLKYHEFKRMEVYRDKKQSTEHMDFKCESFDDGKCLSQERLRDENRPKEPVSSTPIISKLASIPFLCEIIEKKFAAEVEGKNGFLYVAGKEFHDWLQIFDKKQAGLTGLKADIYPASPSIKRSSKILYELKGGEK